MTTAVRRHLGATVATTLWGRLPSGDDAPVLTVEPGEQISLDTVSHEGIMEDQGRDPVTFFGRHGVAPQDVLADTAAIASNAAHTPADGPHVVTGPIEVRGARVGDYLAVHVDRLLPRTAYGVISSRHAKGLLPEAFPLNSPLTSVFCSVLGLDESDPATALATLPLTPGAAERPVRFPLAPFLGVMGVATPGPERLHSTPPGLHGGNLDISLLREGSTLYLPVQVPGAGFYAGDPHLAQGNGEIALTALEAPLRATLTFDVVPAAHAAELFGAARGPVARTPHFLVPTGLDTDLDEAVAACARNALEVLGASFGMAPELAYAYLSAATDFDISQVVDVVKGVHARIRLSDFALVEGSAW
ncbi:acetamidase/formamidase [Streptomyces aurantiacus]|uniref:acetamidase/formamidase family protein n=1 Tax=Streptomyces aurantiacus TaxID=47760 RepID=UPI00278CF2B6|nr:acetamidase/formamidase family protein [Streptomyces aurantiacus]MDQ0777501.1 acetamidase/formamidase [Streptomyces aurantiacus]